MQTPAKPHTPHPEHKTSKPAELPALRKKLLEMIVRRESSPQGKPK
jgi:hypothetical protein